MGFHGLHLLDWRNGRKLLHWLFCRQIWKVSGINFSSICWLLLANTLERIVSECMDSGTELSTQEQLRVGEGRTDGEMNMQNGKRMNVISDDQ